VTLGLGLDSSIVKLKAVRLIEPYPNEEEKNAVGYLAIFAMLCG